jgi:DNA-binding response OmpR family regulator
MAGESPLPPGCTFRIWPTYRLSFRGREVRLPKGEAELLLFLMSQPGRSFSALEIANAVYAHREDGGPDLPKSTIGKRVFDLRTRFRHAGIDLRLKNPLTKTGVVYTRDSLRILETPKAMAERAGVRLGARTETNAAPIALSEQPEGRDPVSLPPGVKFHIHPVYCLEVDGISVYPGEIQAEILMFLLSCRGRVYSAREIARAVYAGRPGETPTYAVQCVMAHIWNLRKLCRVAGIELTLKHPEMRFGYTFVSVALTDKGRAELRRRNVIGAENLPTKPRQKKAADNRHTDTSDWAFPERHERRCKQTHKQHRQ